MIKKGDYWVKCTTAKSHCFTEGKSYKIIDGIICTDQGDYKVLNGMASKFTKLYTIQDLKDGKVAVVNDGTIEDLSRVLNSAFPNCYESSGTYRFYNSSNPMDGWRGSLVSFLPTQSVKDFIVQLPKEEKPSFNTGGFLNGSLEYNVKNGTINPKHYSFTIKGTPCDLFDIGNAMDLNKEQFTALRYFRKKDNQIEDTKKAIKCLERLVERLEAEKND